MIRSRPEMIDDMARVAGGAVGILSGIGKQISIEVRAHAGAVADRLDLARAEDVARLETLVKTLRLKQEEILHRLAALETGHTPAAPVPPKQKTLSKPRQHSAAKTKTKQSTSRSAR